MRPKIVDWNNGRAGRLLCSVPTRTPTLMDTVFGYRESEIMKMISQIPKETNSV